MRLAPLPQHRLGIQHRSTVTSTIQDWIGFESNDSNTMTAMFEHPGLTSDGITIDVHQNRLTVSGEPAAPDSEEKNYVVRERRSGKFTRGCSGPFGTKISSFSPFECYVDAVH
ncbi:hypothetical protein JVT61DRAFT_1464 [Boletus reticuloceps]|uniref:SHSP domain-containing protein n=1 Tax=Boletus reticuloceps TaxID=495285 RepID=A0A8I2YC18_9AGAM|nr:hypothetical protein JVT61DRAFT_1464 [Boletus reticuloceps]